VRLNRERSDFAGAEGFRSLEGNMCGAAMRGADALPGSKATSRAKGSRRNLEGLGSDRQDLRERDGPHREARHNTHWTQSQARVTNALEGIGRECRHTPEVGEAMGRRGGGYGTFLVHTN
jgi:hypothetical protein